MQFHMWPSVVFMDIRLKMQTGMQKKYDKNSQVNGSFSVFLTAPSCFNKQKKCRYERTFKEKIILLKYQYFRFNTKTGAHFELWNWLEKSTKAFDIGGL